MSIELNLLGTFETGIFDEGAAEINAYDPASQRLFVINSDASTVDILDLSAPANPVKIGQIDASAFGAGANSVAVKDGLIAVAIEAEVATDPGLVAFFDADGNFLKQVTVGALPDMVTFTPDGDRLLVANEGEPDDGVDPDGSVSIIDLAKGLDRATVKTAGFQAFNAQRDSLVASGVRIFPGNTVAQDVEPEYIAVSENGKQAFISLQEANAVAVLDIRKGKITEILPLGAKDHSLAGNGIDASDRDDAINIQNWPVFGLYMPDAIDAYDVNGQTYIVTANEGDARDEDDRVDDLELDPTAFPNADELQENENLGRLEVSTIDGDVDGDGDFDQLFSYGARSFSIFDSNGQLVFDSGDDFEQITAALFPADFNSNNDENDSFDSRSDAKGPEPEGVVVGEVGRRTYAFVGLERVGGVMVYDITNPAESTFVQYINNRDFSGDAEAGTAGDLGPEGLTFIAAEDSPNGKALLVVSNEVSGSTSIYEIDALARDRATSVEFLGIEEIPSFTEFSGTTIGGLSGITFDPSTGNYLSVSDDRGAGADGTPRFYELSIDLSDGSLDDGDVTFLDVTALTLADGTTLDAINPDPEGIALDDAGQLYISSERDLNGNPAIYLFNEEGVQTGELAVDEKFLPDGSGTRGVRNNLGFESLTLTPDQKSLYTATESALFQDGQTATTASTAPARIVKYDAATGEAVAEFAYEVDAIANEPNPAGAFADSGLVELLAIDNNGSFLALERSFSVGAPERGYTGKLYVVTTAAAANIIDDESLPSDLEGSEFATKTLLADLGADFGIVVDNIEGMTFGPELADGRMSLLNVCGTIRP